MPFSSGAHAPLWSMYSRSFASVESSLLDFFSRAAVAEIAHAAQRSVCLKNSVSRPDEG